MSGAEPMALAKFAMGVGRSSIPFKPGGAESRQKMKRMKRLSKTGGAVRDLN